MAINTEYLPTFANVEDPILRSKGIRNFGNDNQIGNEVYQCEITGNNNFVGDGCSNIQITGNSNQVIAGNTNVKIVGMDNLTINESNVTYIDGVKIKAGVVVPLYNVINGGQDVVRALNWTSFVNLINGGKNEVTNIGGVSPIKIINGGLN